MRTSALLTTLTLTLTAMACSDLPTRSPDRALPGSNIRTASHVTPANVTRVPLDGSFFNPCSGESIAWSGAAVFVERFVLAPGSLHRIELTQLHATGTGELTGDHYELQQAGGLSANGHARGTNPATSIVPVTVVNTTSGGVYHATLHFHVTRNALGEIVVVFNRFDFECRGRP